MTAELSNAEVGMLTNFRVAGETVEAALHRLLLPFVSKDADARLQILADEYRRLTPELQIEALQVLKTWKATKL